MGPTTVPRFLTLRDASERLRLRGSELLQLLEEMDAEVTNLGTASRPRYRVRESDVLELLKRARRPDERSTRDRAELIEALAAERVLGGVR